MKTDYPQLVALLQILKRRLKENAIFLDSLNGYRNGAVRELNGIVSGGRRPNERNISTIVGALWCLVQDNAPPCQDKGHVDAMWKSFSGDLRKFTPNQNLPIKNEESLRAILYAVAGFPTPEMPDPLQQPKMSLMTAPPLPSLIIGREEALRELKARLTVPAGDRSHVQVLTAIRGWPGVGKTTIAAALAHDPDIAAMFPDGVLWTSLGTEPEIQSALATWGCALGFDDVLRCATLRGATTLLAGLLRDKRMLLVVDDAWEVEHVLPFKVGGAGCAMLVTTRVNKVAQAITPTPDQIYRLDVLNDEKALELLQILAPSVFAQHPKESLELVREIEGLPLAIQVAGRLLHVETSYGFGVRDLLKDLRDGAKLLEAQMPTEQTVLLGETIPTVAVLLRKSTDSLDPKSRKRFSYLGAFPSKPATFDLRAIRALWRCDNVKPTIRQFVDRGLLEWVPGTDRYQMHALLALHAQSLCRRN